MTQLETGFRVYLSGLHPSLNELDVRSIAAVFGEVTQVIMHQDGGDVFVSCTVQYKKKIDAIECFKNCDGFEILDMPWSTRPEFPVEEALRKTNAPKPTKNATPVALVKASELPSVGVPSIYVSLKNMFITGEYTILKFILSSRLKDEGEVRDIELDVQEGCAGLGTVVRITVDRPTSLVLIQFADVAGAEKVVHKMHGLKYNGKQVLAEFISKSLYELYLS